MNNKSPQTAALPKALAIPVLAWSLFAAKHFSDSPLVLVLAVLALFAAVLSAVHHAEVIAAKVGEPFGALVLALAVTVIEVSIIVSLMSAGGQAATTLARDTVFAAVMIILTGMCGLTLLIGGIKYGQQEFMSQGVVSILTILVTISVLTLILPNFTVEVAGPFYSRTQLIFVAICTLLLYGVFLFVQNFKHRSHFVEPDLVAEWVEPPSPKATALSALLLPLNLFAVVMLAESLAPDLESFIAQVGAPHALSGIIIACVVLLPEGISALKAALQNKTQKSLNLSLGSALASISLTIPVVALVSLFLDMPLALGIDTEAMVVFLLSLFVIILSLSKGKTTILQGMVLLVLFAVYLFITIDP